MINVTDKFATERAENARHSYMNYVGETYPHYQGELDELKAALVGAGCRLEEYLTPTKKQTAVDVYFRDLYSGGITLYEGVWTLVVTDPELVI